MALIAWSQLGGDVAIGKPDPVPGLVAGAQVLLVVVDKTSEEAPGIQGLDRFLVPIGGDAGVFDIVGDTAVARSAEVKALVQSDVRPDGSGPPLTSSVDALMDRAPR